MKHITTLDSLSLPDSWLTIGVFDGVHRGHQYILRQLVAGAHQAGLPAVVLTFHPHPLAVLRGFEHPFYLSLPDERAALLGALGVDVVVTQPFTQALANEPGEVFLARLKRHLGFSHLWVGHDFAMGRRRDTDIDQLRALQSRYHYLLEVQQAVEIEGQVISSSLIRTWLEHGDVEQVNKALGRLYTLQGQVVPGDARGRTIGIPTANVAIPPERLAPQRGVYACRVVVGGKTFRGATNIGIRPTFNGARLQQTIETHLLDFEGNLYGQEVQVQFLKRLRGEQRFESVQALIAQIHQDIRLVREVVAL